ncbi:hypothetical protein [Halorubrum sp. Ib24]|uniref:hypothetical protein n=1 Tax=Halorubrum sp. Ib24 TaxID=1383850 RepID=UPI001F52E8B8|nr:hypothetical protein [Halorubrum sp. Ib24]
MSSIEIVVSAIIGELRRVGGRERSTSGKSVLTCEAWAGVVRIGLVRLAYVGSALLLL